MPAHIKPTFILIALIFTSAVTALENEQPIKIGQKKQLFVDHYIIGNLENVSLEVG